MLSIGAIIWISVRPLIRLVLCVLFGFAITKADIFPVIASRGAGQIILKITLPCLMFSKIVPAFSLSNIATLGPLFLVAFIYEAIGLVLAWIIKQFFWVPHRFRYGILQAGAFGNWADLPTSVVMSITAGPPFNPATDQTIAVAYVSAFIFIFFVTLFPCGGNRFVAWDFVGPEVEDDERRELIRQKRQMIKNWRHLPALLPASLRRRKNDDGEHASGEEVNGSIATPMHEKKNPSPPDEESISDLRDASSTDVITRNVSFAEDGTTAVPSEHGETVDLTSRAASPTHVDDADQDQGPESSTSAARFREKEVRFHEPTPPPTPTMKRRIFGAVRSFVLGLLSPASLSVILAFPIALVTPLKGLFVTLPNSPIPNAPDGQPPLAFVMDTASFVGAGSVPLGLICLGSALARLKVPMNAWKTMPVGSIMSLALGKIVLMPVLGVLICQGLTNVGVINKDDKVLRFVCIFFSCLPTATTQVYLTQVYSNTGTADHISAFLIPQYILMIFAMTILTAYSINLLF